jgi:hypothetical protein
VPASCAAGTDCAIHAPTLQGHSVLFLTAAQLLLDLGAQESARGLDRRLRFSASVAHLVVDEVGDLSFDPRSAELLFQVISRRYERRASCSPPTSRSRIGPRPSRTPRAPPQSSTASSTTPTSSPSRATATDSAGQEPQRQERPRLQEVMNAAVQIHAV